MEEATEKDLQIRRRRWGGTGVTSIKVAAALAFFVFLTTRSSCGRCSGGGGGECFVGGEGLPLDEMALQIATAHGPCGNNSDYLFLLEKAMFDIGHEEEMVIQLASEVRKVLWNGGSREGKPSRKLLQKKATSGKKMPSLLLAFFSNHITITAMLFVAVYSLTVPLS